MGPSTFGNLKTSKNYQQGMAVALTTAVNFNEMKISSNPAETLVAFSIGSGIGMTGYDPIYMVGGMLNFMLPSSAAREAPSFPASTRERMIGHNSRIVLLKMTLITYVLGISADDWYFPWIIAPKPTKTAITVARGRVLTKKV